MERPLYDVLVELARRNGMPPATFMVGELRKVGRKAVRDCDKRARVRERPIPEAFRKPHWKDVPAIDIP